MTNSADEVLALFFSQWQNRDVQFGLDDPNVRDDVALMLSGMLTILAVAPRPVWNEFVLACQAASKTVLPPETQEQIKAFLEKTAGAPG